MYLYSEPFFALLMATLIVISLIICSLQSAAPESSQKQGSATIQKSYWLSIAALATQEKIKKMKSTKLKTIFIT
ncbi:MAG: hypothetical protein KGS46_03615 [Chloroflexi bacterium]|jgi:cytochrome c biogenesis protein ResB|nr:hypothetical protein [Chloroflexota bacterium]